MASIAKSHSVDWATHWKALAYINRTGNTNVGAANTTLYSYTPKESGIYSLAMTIDGGNAGGTQSILNGMINIGGTERISAFDTSRANYAGNQNTSLFLGITLPVDTDSAIEFKANQQNRTSSLVWRCVVQQIY